MIFLIIHTGEQLNSLSSALNSATYYESIVDQGSAVFSSIITGHIFDNGVKRTSSEFITKFAKDNDLTLKLDAQGLEELSTKLASKLKEGEVRPSVEELSEMLFGTD